MYHDQVLTPLKTLYGYDAVNITLDYLLYVYLLIMDQMKNDGKKYFKSSKLNQAINFLDKHCFLKLKKV